MAQKLDQVTAIFAARRKRKLHGPGVWNSHHVGFGGEGRDARLQELHKRTALLCLGSQPTAELVHGSNEGVVSHRSAHVVPGCRRGWLHHLVLLWSGLDVPGCLLQQLRLVYDIQHLSRRSRQRGPRRLAPCRCAAVAHRR